MVDGISNDDPSVIENLTNEEIEKSIDEIVSKTNENLCDRFVGFFKRFFKE